MNSLIDPSPAQFASTSSSSPSPMSPPRAALPPLQNHNYRSLQSSKEAFTVFSLPFPKHQPQIPRISFKNVSTVQDDASPTPSTSSTTSTSTAPPTTTPFPNDNDDDVERAKFLAKFDYVDMRSRLTHVELVKKPYLNEKGVRSHSPAMPSVSYDTIFQTTHDFLNLNTTLHMYPTFVDLPSHLRPSKTHYDATRQSEDQMLHVRCLFCRGRFGGKNAKALWERHVKDHWPEEEPTILTPLHLHKPLSKEAQQTLLRRVDRNKQYQPFPKRKQQIPRTSFKTVSTIQHNASSTPSTSYSTFILTAPPTTTTPIPNDNDDFVDRATFLAEFDYVHMRSHLTHVELAKMPRLNEKGVQIHSPAVPSVSYDTIFQTTHDFLNLNITLHMYPTFVDLPTHLRPSKTHYDATKQSEDQRLRVRCLFCRGRFGGKNAKALWERHVKDHWPKEGESTINIPHRHHEPLSEEAQVLLKWVDCNKQYPKEEPRRTIRQIQKHPTGSLQLP